MMEIRSEYFSLFNKLCERHNTTAAKGLTRNESERIALTLAMIPPAGVVRTMLDVGCRDGRITNLLHGKYDVTGLDIGEESLKKVKGKAVVGSIENLPFANNSFDLLLCTEVLEHLPAGVLAKGIAELKRVSRRYLLVSVPNGENLVKGYIRCRKCSKVHHQCGHLHSFSREKLCGLFDGWRPETVSLTGEREANWGMSLPYHLLHYLGKEWADAEVDLCPYCGYSNERPDKRTAAAFLLERAIWKFERLHPLKNLNHLAVLFKKAPEVRQ